MKVSLCRFLIYSAQHSKFQRNRDSEKKESVWFEKTISPASVALDGTALPSYNTSPVDAVPFILGLGSDG